MEIILLFYLTVVAAYQEYVTVDDITSGSGLPEQITIDIRRNRRSTRLNLQENKRLNENAHVYDSDFENGKHILVKRNSPAIRGVKFYQDKENGAAVKVTYDETSTGRFKRTFEGSVNIGQEMFDIRPVSTHSTISVLRGSRDISQNIHLISSVEKVDHSRVRKRDIEDEEFIDYVVPSNITVTGGTSRKKREEGQTEYAVEVIVTVDTYLWQKYYDRTTATAEMNQDEATVCRLKEHFAHIINGVSLRYEAIEDPELNIYVTISGFLIYKTENSSSPVPKGSDAPVLDGKTWYVRNIKYLEHLKQWQAGLELKHDDHIMVFTGCDLHYGSDPKRTASSTGIAYAPGACTESRVSVVEDRDYFITTSVAAHELGHNLGGRHDEEDTYWMPEPCTHYDDYIMSRFITILHAFSGYYSANPWRFSRCSIYSFKLYFQSAQGQCLTDHRDYYNKTEWDIHNRLLPGEMYSLDEQCKRTFGEGSGPCPHGLQATDERICLHVMCREPNTPDWYISCMYPIHATRGSPCGNPADNKWCIEGKCVAKAPAG